MKTIHLILVLSFALVLTVGCSEDYEEYSDEAYMDAFYTEDSDMNFDDEFGPQPASLENNSTSRAFTASAGSKNKEYRRYTEQRENAYSFEAPAGWNVQAQIIRKSPTIYRSWNVLASPDGAIYIAGGLPERFMFMEPNQMTQMYGMREGSSLDGNVVVARYQGPAAFAQQNIGVISGPCGNIQITGTQNRPDEAREAEQKARRDGDWIEGAQSQGAEVNFTCNAGNGTVQGSIIAVTTRIHAPGTGTMWVGAVRGYITPAERQEEARTISKRIAQSHQFNPQWKAQQKQAQKQQQQAQMRASQTAHQQRMAQRQASFNAHQQRMASNQAAFDATQRSMADQRAAFDSYNQSWHANQNTMDQMQDQFTGYIRDETRVWDTNTGKYYDVESGSDNYYIDQYGNTIVGTPGYVGNPDPGTYNQMYEGYNNPQSRGNNR